MRLFYSKCEHKAWQGAIAMQKEKQDPCLDFATLAHVSMFQFFSKPGAQKCVFRKNKNYDL